MMNKEYFGLSILSMGSWIEKGQVGLYAGRVGLMAAGAMIFEYGLAMGFNFQKLFAAAHLFTGKVTAGDPGTVTKVMWVLAIAFAIHFAAFWMVGWKKFKKTLDGDEVAMSIFEDMNVTILDEEAR